jgi:hypothetical protein
MRHFTTVRLVRGVTACIAIAALACLAGCARPVGSVSGKVTFQGKRLKGGYVTFVSTEGQPSKPAEIGIDGIYTIPSITAGSYKICVETDSLRPRALPVAEPGTKMKGPTAGNKEGFNVPEGYTPSSPADASIVAANQKNAARFVAIPPSYGTADKTTLSYNVVGGEQTYDIELK